MSEVVTKMAEPETMKLSKSTRLIFRLLQEKHQAELSAAVEVTKTDAGIREDEEVTLDLQQGLWVFPPKPILDE